MVEQVIGERERVALMNLRPCSGSGAVQRELAQLEAAELVTVRRVGNQKHYQAMHRRPYSRNCVVWY
jgi:hypothetical protein